jgi:protein required for attachment to host cells
MISVFNTNSNTCRIYQYIKKPTELTFLKKLQSNAAKLKTSELEADRPGHYQKGETSRGAYSPHMDGHDVAVDNFAREISEELESGRVNAIYKKIVIITPPKMFGILSKHINKNVERLIIKDIQSDMIHLKDHELLDYLKEQLKPELF